MTEVKSRGLIALLSFVLLTMTSSPTEARVPVDGELAPLGPGPDAGEFCAPPPCGNKLPDNPHDPNDPDAPDQDENDPERPDKILEKFDDGDLPAECQPVKDNKEELHKCLLLVCMDPIKSDLYRRVCKNIDKFTLPNERETPDMRVEQTMQGPKRAQRKQHERFSAPGSQRRNIEADGVLTR